MILRRLLAAAALGLALTACTAPNVPASDAPPVTSPAIAAVVHQPGIPVSISIPKQGVTDEVVPVGLAADGSMEVPDVSESGWYRLGPKPGERGAAVVIGHVDWKGTPGALGRIGELHSGDVIVVKDQAGIERLFGVYDVQQIPKSQYAAKTVALAFGARSTDDLVLVTCSGVVVNHEYQSNTIVSARLAA